MFATAPQPCYQIFPPQVVILKVNARDRDSGDNGRVSYFLKVNNANVAETEKFAINEITGELRARGRFDREERER